MLFSLNLVIKAFLNTKAIGVRIGGPLLGWNKQEICVRIWETSSALREAVVGIIWVHLINAVLTSRKKVIHHH